jgi:hypothetical protein
MNPSVEAALIAAVVSLVSLGGTVIVAISGFRNTKQTNERTIDSGTEQLKRTLDAARDDKLWDKRTQTYEEVTAYLLFIQAKRRLEARRRDVRFDDAIEEANNRLLGEYKPASWWELQGRLAIYGSDEVIAAFEGSHNADNEVAAALFRATNLRQQGQDLDEARKRADAIDQALAKLARAELNRKPSAATTLQPVTEGIGSDVVSGE